MWFRAKFVQTPSRVRSQIYIFYSIDDPVECQDVDCTLDDAIEYCPKTCEGTANAAGKTRVLKQYIYIEIDTLK